MTTRRQFLHGSLATTGLLAFSAVPGFASVLTPDTRLRLHGAVFEATRPASAAFGVAAGRLGLPEFGIAGDMTPVWNRVIELWRKQPVAIAGLTTLTPLLLLEQSARDYGLRVAFRAEHRSGADGVLVHALQGPKAVIDAFSATAPHDADFGACVARAIVRCPAETRPTQTASVRTAETVDDAPLYSWVLAPRRPQQGAKV